MLQEHDHRVILEHIDECVIVLNGKYQLVYCNPPSCELFGLAACNPGNISLSALLQLVQPDLSVPTHNEEECLRFIQKNDLKIHSRWYEWRVKTFDECDMGSKSLLLVGHDITERKEKELTLAASNARNRQFIDNQPVGMFRSLLEGEGSFVFANPAAAELLGSPSVESLLQTTVLSRYENPEDRKKLIQRLLKEEKIVGFEVKSRKVDGTSITVSLSLQLIRDSKGNPVAIDASIFDITDRKKIEQALWLTQFIYDQAAIGIYRLDEEARIIDVNELAAHMLGYSRDELCSMHLWDIDPDISPSTWPDFWAGAGEGFRIVERRHRKRNGEYIAVEITSSIIEYAGQQYSIAFATDTSERKQMQEKLLKSEKMHRQAQQLAKLGHWEKVFESNEIVWSDEIYRIYEFDKQQLTPGSNLYEMILARVHPEDITFVGRAIEDAVKRGTEIDFVHRIVLPEKRIKHLHVIASIEYRQDGTPLKIVGTVQDITARREAEIEKEQMEKKLLQSQKLEAIGTLAGGIAHDFNNILTSIIGFTQLALQRMPEGNKAVNSLEQVVKAGIRARELVAHILAFSRQDEQVLEKVDLKSIITEIVRLLRASIPANVELHQDIAADCCTVLGVPVQFHQILVNLCTNSYQAIGSSNGRITIKLRNVNIGKDDLQSKDAPRPGRYVQLTVADTGCGMEPSTLEHIFDPYFSTKQKGGGTGLGLSVVHGIVKSHGGYIQVRSDPGKGAIFLVYFPCVQGQARDDMPPREKILPVGEEYILVVDDEKTITELLYEMLTNLGYEVKACNDPEIAVQYYQANANTVDLILTDLTMPGMDGVELAAIIRKTDEAVPIVLQSGFSELVTREKLDASGITSIIRKPILETELAHCIREALDGYTRQSKGQ
ncbi:PAS domain S-box protein [Desulfogranum japonicum]|uniref:PAS domain S-box protein n=1 Tax=Desulfogranum japonicum TaxID=231447 RepID=UPI000688560C|nr:PAS domain S-box protein [Desulfogranum japonicum]